jgi:hypothetical protein
MLNFKPEFAELSQLENKRCEVISLEKSTKAEYLLCPLGLRKERVNGGIVNEIEANCEDIRAFGHG